MAKFTHPSACAYVYLAQNKLLRRKSRRRGGHWGSISRQVVFFFLFLVGLGERNVELIGIMGSSWELSEDEWGSRETSAIIFVNCLGCVLALCWPRERGRVSCSRLGIGLGSQEIFRIFVIYPSIFFGFITILPPDFSVQCTQPILILRA